MDGGCGKRAVLSHVVAVAKGESRKDKPEATTSGNCLIRRSKCGKSWRVVRKGIGQFACQNGDIPREESIQEGPEKAQGRVSSR